MMYCTTLAYTHVYMDIPFVYAPYVYWKMSEWYTGVAFVCAFIFQYTLGHAKMEYPVMYTPGWCSTLFNMYCATPELCINSTSCLVLHKMGVECSASAHVTPARRLRQKSSSYKRISWNWLRLHDTNKWGGSRARLTGQHHHPYHPD